MVSDKTTDKIVACLNDESVKALQLTSDQLVILAQAIDRHFRYVPKPKEAFVVNGVFAQRAKKHTGKTVQEVLSSDPQYIDWLIKGDGLTEPERSELIELRNQAAFSKWNGIF